MAFPRAEASGLGAIEGYVSEAAVCRQGKVYILLLADFSDESKKFADEVTLKGIKNIVSSVHHFQNIPKFYEFVIARKFHSTFHLSLWHYQDGGDIILSVRILELTTVQYSHGLEEDIKLN